MELINLFNSLQAKEVFFRLENDDEGFCLSIIDRSKYPRVWIDNFHDRQVEVIAETVDNIINKTIFTEKDWQARFTCTTIDECIIEFEKWAEFNMVH